MGNRRGFTLIELVIVMLLIAVVATMSVPRALKSSPQLQVNLAAQALTRDLEQLRMRAIAGKRAVRVRFAVSDNFYSAFMDVTADRSGAIGETADEVRASGLLTQSSLGGLPGVRLAKGVIFGVGSAGDGPSGAQTTGPVTLEGGQLQFDAHGMVDPPGTGGVIYMTHELDPSAVAAVTVSGASAFRAYVYRGGRWTR